MAAGLGSRFGGLKQIEPVDSEGHIIMDFSIFDAKRAGFEHVIFIIKEENHQLFKEAIGNRVSKHMEVTYVFQGLDKLPDGYTVPVGREKPFGTGHAVLCCKDEIDGPFVVINADDYYGVKSFGKIYDYLMNTEDKEKYTYSMVGYHLGNTMTENGFVSRGVCDLDKHGYLVDITERTHIEYREGDIMFTEDGEQTWEIIDPTTFVSMNLFGFTCSFMDELDKRFRRFLDNDLPSNPLKAEFFLPSVVGDLISEGKANVKVLESTDKWYGITYKEDKIGVKKAVEKMKEEGVYPQNLWL